MIKKAKYILFFLCLILFTSCNRRNSILASKTRIMTTIFPVYDWTRTLINEGKNERLLLNVVIKNSFDIHLFVPSSADLQQISNAKMVIYTGKKIDSWVEEALQKPNVENQIAVNLSKEILKRQPEALLDEHFWLIPEYAIMCCDIITEKLETIDSEHYSEYQQFNQEYTNLLKMLHQDFEIAGKTSGKPILIADRNTFAPLFNHYGIKYYSFSDECPSSLTNINYENFSKLLDENQLSAVYITEMGDKKNAQAVIDGSKNPLCDILTIDTLHCTTLNLAFYGKSYLSTMQENLLSLRIN